MADITIVSGNNVRINLHCASLASRAVALGIDVAIILLYVYCIICTTEVWMFLATEISYFWIRFLSYFILGLIPLLYIPLCETFHNGQTIGKQIMGIRVVRTDGEHLTFGCIMLRYLLLYVDAVIGLGMGCILIAMSKKSQRLGDMAAGTAVVHCRAYKQSRLDWSDYDFLYQKYHTIYPRAAELTPKQAAAIEHTLQEQGQGHELRLERLAEKVERLCGKRNHSTPSPEIYLQQVLNDYRYVQTEAG